MSDIHVTYDGDTYWLQCFSDDPSAEKGVIIDPIDIGDSWVTLGEKVTEHEAQHGCSPAGEDAPGNEPAKVIVVVEASVGDRAPVERRYLAHEADDHRDYGFLRIRRDDRPVACYAQGAWLSARDEGALVPDATLRHLGVVLVALREIGRTVLEADDKRRVVVRIARDVLEQIAEADL